MKKMIILCIALIAGSTVAFSQIRKEPEMKVVKKALVPVEVTKKAPAHKDLKITSHAEGATACGPIQILGIGEPGLHITVTLYAYANVSSTHSNPWSIFKKSITSFGNPVAIAKEATRSTKAEIQERYYDSYDVVIDKNGKWYIPVFQSVGKPDWMRALWMPFAWTISAVATDPNYRKGNYTSINVGCGG